MARSKFNQSLAINKDHVMGLQLRGDLLYHSGEPDMAIRDFNVRIFMTQGYSKCFLGWSI